jgi:two-component system OmpR family sensor kinase
LIVQKPLLSFDVVAAANGAQQRLDALEQLFMLSGMEMKAVLSSAADVTASCMHADKVDAFLYDPTRDSLVALGRSQQPLSAIQKRLGLDVLQVSNGGRAVDVFLGGRTFACGELEHDQEELRGVKVGLGVRSTIGVPLDFGGTIRGVLMLASQEPNFWHAEDVAFAETIARWVSLLAHRAELVEQATRAAEQQAQRAAAEELITVVAHDLRNAMAPMQMRVQRLIKRRADKQRDDDAADLDVVAKLLRRFDTMLSDVLDVARIKQSLFRVQLEPVALKPVLQELLAVLGTPERPLQLHAAEDVTAVVDPARLRQALENLLANALKHSPPGTSVFVLLTRERHNDGEWACIDVVDQGPGVPASLVPIIFERFVKGTNASGGLGLGLYLSKQIALLHNGDLTVHTEPGGGARFRLSLPCANAELSIRSAHTQALPEG